MRKNLLAALIAFIVFSSFRLNAQQAQPVFLRKELVSVSSFNEAKERQMMKKDGLSQPVIDKLIAERKLFIARSKETHGLQSQYKNLSGGGSTLTLNCSDLGAENGWGAWNGAPGQTNSGNPCTFSPATNPPPASNANTCFNITSGTGIDACTPGTDPSSGGPGPAIPVVAPGFGNSSIQIGCPQTPGCYAEQITYAFSPTPQDTNLIYAYAVILFDPGSSHAVNERPFVDFVILDQTGDTVPCSFNHYTAPGGGTLPGFYLANAGCSGGTSTFYKPWTTIGVNLKNYIGQTLTIKITNVDCSQCGHYAHSYFDFSCGSIPLNGGCSGSSSTICAAASDPSNPYAYQWYKNGTLLGGATNQCVAVVPYSGDSYIVKVTPAFGCPFYMDYKALAGAVQALFTYNSNINVVNFTDLSTGATAYSWDFGDGGTSTQQNPSHTYPSPGTYTACLVAHDATCYDTVCKVITIAAVGMDEQVLASSVSVFPSPALKNVYLDFGGNNFGKAEVSFSNVIGEILFSSHIPASGKQMLDVATYPEGIYFVRIKTNSGSVTKKIIISR